jgi:hypothetical protein
MSLPCIGIAVPAYSATSRTYVSKEEQAFISAQHHERVFRELRREEEVRKQVKAERKRIKKEAKAKAKAQSKGRTLEPKKNKAQRLLTYVKVKVFRPDLTL